VALVTGERLVDLIADDKSDHDKSVAESLLPSLAGHVSVALATAITSLSLIASIALLQGNAAVVGVGVHAVTLTRLAS
jgi:hypothetical protein